MRLSNILWRLDAFTLLGTATLGGKSVYVLTMTRAGDRVLVRCYPGYQPSIKIQSMGGANAAKEGVMTCNSPA
ncbi:MAG: hypothetical protein LH702_11055 [Phormidesmis sp. CAN_BIN44]|nr:hypothetical protein [Phormidesmis sp. CAN_BIN44]